MCRLPFDWKTPYGYMIVACMKVAASFSATFIATVFICLMIGSCWSIKLHIKATTYNVSMLKMGKKSFKNVQKCKKRISTIVQDFIETKQLSCWTGLRLFCLFIYAELVNSILFQTGQRGEWHFRAGFLCGLCLYSCNHMWKSVDTSIGSSWV